MEQRARRDLELSLRDAERRAYEAEAAYETLLKQVPGAIYAYAPELGGPTLSMSAYVRSSSGYPPSGSSPAMASGMNFSIQMIANEHGLITSRSSCMGPPTPATTATFARMGASSGSTTDRR